LLAGGIARIEAGERAAAGRDPQSELYDERGVDRVVDSREAGLAAGWIRPRKAGSA
jgi:hypothetical protein